MVTFQPIREQYLIEAGQQLSESVRTVIASAWQVSK